MATQHYTAQEWSAYTDGELSEARREEMRAHRAVCGDCAALARSFEAVQRGSEELARRAAPPSAGLRPRLLVVGAAVLGKKRSRRRWLGLLAMIFGAVVVAAVWFARPQPKPPPVNVTINNVLITRLLIYPPSLDYELTIQNHSDKPLVITSVITNDPLGEVERRVEPPLRIEAGQSVQRVFGRLVAENITLPAGRYRIWLVTESGNLSAERILETSLRK